ncbi:MAG TPA: hypothetical protein ENH85_09790 [Candidatus Scalindua sp.]|nr:hypothetical protein [Candidatus Scalindua sp.]
MAETTEKTIGRIQRIQAVEKLQKQLNASGENKTKIIIKRFVRRKIIQNEVVDAYITPVANGIETPMGRKQVNRGNWIVIHADGKQASYTPEEFAGIYELVEPNSNKGRENVLE